MSTVKMSVHRGLGELKLYSNKIESGLSGAFVVANKKSNKTIGGKSIEEVENAIKGNFDSVVALLENRNIIKDAIIKSNATTIVTVAGKEMSVAEAIERKNSILLSKEFVDTLQRQFMNENHKVEVNNEQLQTKLESFLQATLGDKRDVETVKSLTKTFQDSNEFTLIDPKHIQDYIAKLSKEIQEFETQVDYVLSESNATTFFEVELKD